VIIGLIQESILYCEEASTFLYVTAALLGLLIVGLSGYFVYVFTYEGFDDCGEVKLSKFKQNFKDNIQLYQLYN